MYRKLDGDENGRLYEIKKAIAGLFMIQEDDD